MDNLIAAGKAVPFIIFMDNGLDVPRREMPAPGQGGGRRGGFGGFFNAFQDVLIKDIIPMVEANYRVIADANHRAMAGLSMGGMQTHGITLALSCSEGRNKNPLSLGERVWERGL